MRTPFVCGNWKLHHGLEASRKQVHEIVKGLHDLHGKVEVSVAPVATVLFAAVEEAKGRLPIAAQNVHFAEKGAFTGEWSVAHLKELGVTQVIIGHSERRAMFGETDAHVGKKVRAALDGGLLPIACVGETLAERDAQQTLKVIDTQMEAILTVVAREEVERVVIAYEPVWAIGTGKNATAGQAQGVHMHIRGRVRHHFASQADRVRILYGGSGEPENAKDIIAEPDVDGALVGGASLEAHSLLAIAKASLF